MPLNQLVRLSVCQSASLSVCQSVRSSDNSLNDLRTDGQLLCLFCDFARFAYLWALNCLLSRQCRIAFNTKASRCQHSLVAYARLIDTLKPHRQKLSFHKIIHMSICLCTTFDFVIFYLQFIFECSDISSSYL